MYTKKVADIPTDDGTFEHVMNAAIDAEVGRLSRTGGSAYEYGVVDGLVLAMSVGYGIDFRRLRADVAKSAHDAIVTQMKFQTKMNGDE